ncbi:MAG: methyl-accepting chemotaxis protein [Planctomycetaceae bacterium]|jgi:methyl-accepting chemotaxis protein|nr:methyl-accepting chemotaxis protein [Planctomycetaceae bacterium]
MLNKFTIGTKLTAGFLFVLILLILLATISYFGLLSVQSNMRLELSTHEALCDMIQVRYSLATAQLASARGVITSDTKYQTSRSQYDDYIKQTSNKIYNSLSTDNQKNLDDLLVTYEKYIEIDNQWYNIDKKQNEMTIQLRQNAETVFQKLEEFAEQVRKLMIQEMRLDNAIEYYTKKRYDQTVEVERAVGLMQAVRRDFYRLLASKGRSEFESVGQSIVSSTLADLRKNLLSIKVTARVENQKIIDEILNTLDEWLDHFNKTLEYLREKDDIAIKRNEYSQDVEKIIADILGILTKYAESVGQNADKTVASILSMIVISSGIAFVFGVIISYFLSRNITSGLKIAMNAVNQVVLEGDLRAEITGDLIARNDEVGEMSRVAASVLSDYREIDAMANALASGNWQITVKEKSSFDSMNQNLGKMLDQVNHALAEIHTGVKEVSQGANGVSSASQTLSAGVQESSSSLEEIVASMNQISGQTAENAKSASEARDLANNTTQAASEGQGAMKQMNEAMLRITKNSEEIQRVIKVIDDIAFQTNLLALNAAVEAARAGTHGKGFAVVAEEVRNLAARSARAAQETSELISTSGREIEMGGKVAAHTSDVLNEIVDQVKQTAELIGRIAIASNEQAQGVSQVSIGLNRIDAVTQQNTAAAEESASAANQMSSMATKLQDLVGRFKLR